MKDERTLSCTLIFLFATALVFGCQTELESDLPLELEEMGQPTDENQTTPDPNLDEQVDSDRVDEESSDVCYPDLVVFEIEVKPLLEAHCGACHGETEQFGAPFSVIDYDALMAGEVGQRPVDRLAPEVGGGFMPPAGYPQPGSESRALIANWASCGAWMGDASTPVNPGGDFDSDRPILRDSEGLPVESDFFDLRAGDFPVGEGVDDRYECFYFEAPVDEPRFIKRIETVLGDARVLHHTILIPGIEGEAGEHGPCDDENPLSLIYGWAPGQGALHFPVGGMRLEPGQGLTLQIHYNNEAGHRDVRDNSGVRIYHGPVEGPEVSMLTFGPLGFRVPAGETRAVDGWCRLPEDVNILYSFPHMHDKGIAFRQVLERPDGEEESVISLDGWDFDSQYIYETPMTLRRGDILKTTCTYENNGERALRWGPNTADEMCFNFAYVTPPPPVTFCNQNEPPLQTVYVPGECAPPGAELLSPAAVLAPFRTGELPDLGGGDAPVGLWTLDAAKIHLDSLSLGGFTIDVEQSQVSMFGVAGLLDGVFYLDAAVEVHTVASGVAFDTVQNISFAGPVDQSLLSGGEIEVEATCGELPARSAIQYGYSGPKLMLGTPLRIGPVSLELVLTLSPVAEAFNPSEDD